MSLTYSFQAILIVDKTSVSLKEFLVTENFASVRPNFGQCKVKISPELKQKELEVKYRKTR